MEFGGEKVEKRERVKCVRMMMQEEMRKWGTTSKVTKQDIEKKREMEREESIE